MFIKLDDLVCYMDRYSQTFFDPNTYELFFAEELPPDFDVSKMLQIPQIEETLIIKKFAETHSVLYKSRHNSVDYVPIGEFHNLINKYEMYDEWIDFRFEFLLDFAENWCHLNNIRFTRKVG